MQVTLVFASDIKISECVYPIISSLDTLLPRIILNESQVTVNYPLEVKDVVHNQLTSQYPSVNFVAWGSSPPKDTDWSIWIQKPIEHVLTWMHAIADIVICFGTELSPSLDFTLDKNKRYIKCNTMNCSLKTMLARGVS